MNNAESHIVKLITLSNQGIFFSVTHVEIDDPENPKKKIILDQHKPMEDAIMGVFKKKCLEVYNTPLVHEPLILPFGQDGLSPEVQKVLDGTLVLKTICSSHEDE